MLIIPVPDYHLFGSPIELESEFPSMSSRLQAMCLVIPLLCVFGCGQSESERNRQAALARGDEAVDKFERLMREQSRLSIQPKFDSDAFSSLTKRMEAATAEADEHYREANKYPKPKYSSVSEIKYLAAIEELKGLQIQLDTANAEMAAAIAAKSLSRLEKAEADIDRIDAAMDKLYAIRNRNAPSSLK